MIRKTLLTTPLFAAAVVKESSSKPDSGYVHTYEATGAKGVVPKSLVYKPSELPIYESIHGTGSCDHHKKVPAKPSMVAEVIEDGFRTVRVSLQSVTDAVSSQRNQLGSYVDTAKDHSQFIFDYLNEEDNTMPRVGAIAVGGLAGLIFGLRGGFFKRLIYTSVGAGGVASICYPKEAKQYAEIALTESKKYANVGYNFVYGVKPGDPNQKELPLPNIPTSVEGLKNSLSELGKAAYDVVFPTKK